MGKNFSRNNASGKRKESDFYETPYCLTRTFLEASDYFWEPSYSIVEPACGHGAVTKVLKEYGFSKIIEYDIATTGKDFLQDKEKYAYLITNPPFSLAQEFILHAKEIIKYKFALLLPLTYLQGSKRLKEIWSDKEFPLDSVYVFNRYPMLGVPLREDGKITTGMQSLAFFTWNRAWKGHEPRIRWIDIDKYVCRKGDTI
jgi:hypothetical protein